MPRGRPKKTEEIIEQKNMVIFLGTSPRAGEIWDRHGLRFEKGVIYQVSDEVYEYLKPQKFFVLVDKISTRVIDFKKG